jgi:hypothetical protein
MAINSAKHRPAVEPDAETELLLLTPAHDNVGAHSGGFLSQVLPGQKSKFL